ncbi:1-acyl-sn-glycerol-3-phosphate acyltransferase [Guggenheimella bovis]
MKLVSNVMIRYNEELKDTPVKDFESYDFVKEIKPQSHLLRPVTWILSAPKLIKHKVKITKDLQGVKPPYILLCNHSSNLDFNVMTMALFPKRANYVVALDAFSGREFLMRNVGCIAKRKFTTDIQLIRQMHSLIKKKQIVVLYPEARYSIDGTTSTMPESLGKLVKLFKVPVVTLMMHGHYVQEPMWAQGKKHAVPTTAEMKTILTEEEIKKLSYEEIFERILKEMEYDEWAYRRETPLLIKDPKRAEGLHRILYKCPHCKSETMNSKNHEVFCESCGKVWEMDEKGVLEALDGYTEFPYVPDWYKWEREEVRKEIENGTYDVNVEVEVDALPNSKGFVKLGKGVLKHNLEELSVTGHHAGEDYFAKRTSRDLYSTHIELNYMDRHKDCVDISTNEETYFCYLEPGESAVKISLAVEEIYFYLKKKEQK